MKSRYGVLRRGCSDQLPVAVVSHGRRIIPGLRPFPPAVRHRRTGAADRPRHHVNDLVVSDPLQGHQPDRAPEAQPEVPDLLLERNLARSSEERAHRAWRARAVRPPDRPFAARPGAPRQVWRGQARGDRQRAGVPDAHHQEGARRGDDVAGKRPHHAGHHRRHRALRRPVRHGVGRLSRPGGDRHERARACSTRSRGRSARR